MGIMINGIYSCLSLYEMDIPSDIRLNMLEYGGERLNVTDEELIERIHLYDETFDYNLWKEDIKEMERFINRVSNSPMIPIYQYLTEHNIKLYIKDEDIDTLGAISFSTDSQEEIDVVVGSLVEMGYDIDMVKVEIEENIFEQIMISSQVHDIQRELLEISLLEGTLYKENWSSSFMFSIVDAEKYDLQSLIYMANIMNMPHTLSSYLRYIIQKKREEPKIKAIKEYPLYLMLEPYRWYYHSREEVLKQNEGASSMNPNDIVTTLWIKDRISTCAISAIHRELIKLYGENDVEYYLPSGVTDEEEFLILKGSILGLGKINRFYHPFILRDFDTFP